jgi:hypothetical protein
MENNPQQELYEEFKTFLTDDYHYIDSQYTVCRDIILDPKEPRIRFSFRVLSSLQIAVVRTLINPNGQILSTKHGNLEVNFENLPKEVFEFVMFNMDKIDMKNTVSGNITVTRHIDW